MRTGMLAVAVPALLGAAPPKAEQVSQVVVVTDRERIGPGETVRVAVLFTIMPRWHTYWKNPGAGSLAPRTMITAPDGYIVGDAQFTRPRVFDEPLGVVYGYIREAAIFIPVTAPDQLDDGHVELAVRIDWAVCKDVCLIGTAQHVVGVTTSSTAVEGGAELTPKLLRHQHRLPRPLREVATASASFDGSTLRVEGPASGMRMVAFFPDRSPGVSYDDVTATVSDDRFLITVAVDVDPNNAMGEPLLVAGLVALGERLEDPCYDFSLSATDEKQRHIVGSEVVHSK